MYCWLQQKSILLIESIVPLSKYYNRLNLNKGISFISTLHFAFFPAQTHPLLLFKRILASPFLSALICADSPLLFSETTDLYFTGHHFLQTDYESSKGKTLLVKVNSYTPFRQEKQKMRFKYGSCENCLEQIRQAGWSKTPQRLSPNNFLAQLCKYCHCYSAKAEETKQIIVFIHYLNLNRRQYIHQKDLHHILNYTECLTQTIKIIQKVNNMPHLPQRPQTSFQHHFSFTLYVFPDELSFTMLHCGWQKYIQILFWTSENLERMVLGLGLQ